MTTVTCEALLFDCDGVLIDSTEAVERSWEQWADSHSLDRNQVRESIHGRRAIDIISHWLPDHDHTAENQIVQGLALANSNLVRPVPGAIELVTSLPPNAWAVATSAVGSTAKNWMAVAGVPLPAVFISAEDVDAGKPAPDCYLQAARRLQATPSKCVVVEDAPNGISAARAAGMRVLGVSTTYEPQQLDTDWIIDDLLGVRDLTVANNPRGLSFEVS